MNEFDYFANQMAHDRRYGMTVPGLAGTFYPTGEGTTWASEPSYALTAGEAALLTEVQRLRILLRWEQVKHTYVTAEPPVVYTSNEQARRISIEFKEMDASAMQRALRQILKDLDEGEDGKR